MSEIPPPANYPTDWVETVVLKDGARLTLRPIRPSDAAGLQEGFQRLSMQSVYMRFLEAFRALSDEQAHHFATVDYQERMAFVAEVEEKGECNLVGVARYACLEQPEPENIGLAESAIVIVDEYQNRGLGSLMLERLIRYAAAHGIKAFLATVHISNTRILRFIERSGFPFEKKILEPGVWEIRIKLEAGNGGH